jgi:hypothetical protein
MQEPSVLDYVKSKLMPWKYPRVEIPQLSALPAEGGTVSEAERLVVAGKDEHGLGTMMATEPGQPIAAGVSRPLVAGIGGPGYRADIAAELEPLAAEAAQPAHRAALPWLSLLALFLVLAAQYSMEPRPERSWHLGAILLVVSLGILAWANLRAWSPTGGEWQAAPLPEQSEAVDPLTLRPLSLLLGLILAGAAYFSFSNLQFTSFNLTLSLAALGFVMHAFWIPSSRTTQAWFSRIVRLPAQIIEKTSAQEPQDSLEWLHSLNSSNGCLLSWLAGLAGVLVVLFFRFYRLGSVPPEMNSDHAEKILDILRVLNGETSVFFPANGGREALIFYMGAALHRFFDVPLGFTLLKLSSVAIGILTLVFVYLLGVEIANRRVGFLAFLLAGIAYWPNVVARFGLRLPFYMLFTASTLYFLLRGIRSGQRNMFIYAGISLGLGIYGYTPDRLLPLLVLSAVGLYLIHRQSKGRRTFMLVSTLVVAVISFIIFLPLMRYIVAEPESFMFRTLTRMGSLERTLEAPAGLIFARNVGRALAMFSWDDGEIWPISIPHYPALSIVSGALFYMGAGLLLLRYLRKRHWLDLFLLLSIPLLQLPSTLALAFPAENPNLYRTGGAMVPVFLMAGLALDGLMTGLASRLAPRPGRTLAWGVALLLLFTNAGQDYNLVFGQFYEQYLQSSWNTSEMGAVARTFAETIGSPDTIWVMGFPYWVDTRLVAINAGYPGRNYELFVDKLPSTQADGRPKMFIINPQDQVAIIALKQLYPQGWLEAYTSKVPTKDFLIFFVPPAQ